MITERRLDIYLDPEALNNLMESVSGTLTAEGLADSVSDPEIDEIVDRCRHLSEIGPFPAGFAFDEIQIRSALDHDGSRSEIAELAEEHWATSAHS